MKKLLSLTLALALVLLLAACGGTAQSQSPSASGAAPAPSQEASSASGGKKVAMLLTGPINDAGWNESAYRGLMAAQETMDIETAYSESLQQPDYETVLSDYADKGYEVIICHGFEFSDAVRAVAPNFPDSMFCVVNGDSTQEPNLASFRFNTPQTGFLAGAAAGLLTKTNTVAMIGGTRMPHIEDALKGFEAGAKYVNPDVTVLSGFSETMSDVAKGKEMGMAFIEQGADVLSTNANQTGLGAIDAATTKGIHYIGYIYDQYDVAPDTVMVSAIQSVQFMVTTIIERGLKGELEPNLYLMGTNDGAIHLSDFHGHEDAFSEGGVEQLEEIFEKLNDGSLAKEGVLPKSIFDVG